MTQTKTEKNKTGFQGTPILGVGLGLRDSLLQETLDATDLLDWVEITPENYMGKGGLSRQRLEKAMAIYPLVSHGVSLSIGSTDPWDPLYIKQLKELFEVIKPAWFSDHLTFSGIDGLYFNDLIPMPRNQESVNHVADRVKYLQDTFQIPVLIENASFYLDYPSSDMTDEVYLAKILEQADCGLLLDVNNVFVNASNHSWNAKAYLDALPLERVVQIHTAGHTEYPEGLVDTHGAAVKETVWELLDYVLQRCQPSGVMLERDLNIPPFSELRPEIERIKSFWEKYYGVLEKSSKNTKELVG